MIKTVKNPSGQKVIFNEEAHTYEVNERTLISVTTFIEQFFPFDSEKISKKYAKKNNLNQADVLAQWKEKSDLGHIVHLYAEKLFKEETLPGSVNPKVQKYFKMVNKTVIKLLKRFDFIDAEMIIFSESLGMAGTIDLLMRDRANGDIVIFDWKTNKEIKKENPWQNALEPIGHLMDCNWNQYQLQLNLYKWILIQEEYFPYPENDVMPTATNYRMALIHLSENKVEWHKVKDISLSVGKMLEFEQDIPF